MVLVPVDELDQTALADAFTGNPGIAGGQRLLHLQLAEAGALDARHHAVEAHLHDFGTQPDGFEQLRTPVGRDLRDAHLRQNLVKPLLHPLAVVLARVRRVADQLAGAVHVRHHLVGEVRIDRGGADPEEYRHLVRVTGVAGLDHDIDARAQRQPGQMMMHRAGRQQRLDRLLAFFELGIRQHQDHLAIPGRLLGLLTERYQRLAQRGGLRVVVQRQPDRGERRIFLGHQGSELARRQHRRGQDQAIGMLGRGLKDVEFRAHAGFQRHHDRFTQRVDRRVGDLGEFLAEKIGEQTVLPRQHRHRRIVAHRADRFLTALGQRAQQLIALLEGHREHLLIDVELVGLHRLEAGQFGQRRLEIVRVLLEPAAIRIGGLEPLVDIVGMQHLAGLGIDGENLPRPDTALGHHGFRLIVPYPDLGGEGDVAVVGDHPARRTQAVAVEHADGMAAVGHDDTGGTVPRLHVHGIVLVEGAQVAVHGLHVLPRRRHHHAHRVVEIHAAGQQHFQHVVHARRIGTGGVDDLVEAFDVRQQLADEVGLARVGPPAVGLDGVDLAVVRHEAERLRQRPARRRIGRETLVENADGGFETLVAQILIEGRQVHGHHQALVGNHLGRQRADVELFFLTQLLLGQATGHEQLDIERGVGLGRLPFDEHLTNARQALERHRPADAGVRGHVAPAHDAQAPLGQLAFQDFPCMLLASVVIGEEHHADREALAQGHVQLLLGQRSHEAHRHLQQQAATVAGLAVRRDTAAVGHACQGFDRRLEQIVTGLPLHMSNQAETAVVAEFAGLVKTSHHGRASQSSVRIQGLVFDRIKRDNFWFFYFYGRIND